MKTSNQCNCGKCIFCRSKCPVCGSDDVDIYFFLPRIHGRVRDNTITFNLEPEITGMDDPSPAVECHKCKDVFYQYKVDTVDYTSIGYGIQDFIDTYPSLVNIYHSAVDAFPDMLTATRKDGKITYKELS